MKLQISHQTNYYYDELAHRSVQYIRMTPMQLTHQIIHQWNVMLPKVATSQKDGFGNDWLRIGGVKMSIDGGITARQSVV